VASLSQGRTAAAQCGLFTYKSVPVIFEPPCMYIISLSFRLIETNTFISLAENVAALLLKVCRQNTNVYTICLRRKKENLRMGSVRTVNELNYWALNFNGTLPNMKGSWAARFGRDLCWEFLCELHNTLSVLTTT